MDCYSEGLKTCKSAQISRPMFSASQYFLIYTQDENSEIAKLQVTIATHRRALTRLVDPVNCCWPWPAKSILVPGPVGIHNHISLLSKNSACFTVLRRCTYIKLYSRSCSRAQFFVSVYRVYSVSTDQNLM